MASRKEGTGLGPYRLIEQIGLGGMATVYKAYQPSMDRYVALKILPAYYAQDPKFIERFNREARTIARLEHKNILPVYDFGEDNGVTYLAMRYLDGGTLKDMLALGRLTLADAVDILSQVCAALDYAHRQGVVHRDVKPANIMVDGEGTAYLTDFGIAKVLEGAPGGLTETGAAIGTPAYMAPEQSLGQSVDRRTDIYALGVILYEVTVGRAPYQAETPMAVALAHIHEPLPLPHDIDPNIPEALERVILKALAKKPEDRYETASEMSAALNDAVTESGISRADTTLRALATQARDQIASQTVKVTPETFAVARAQALTAETPPRRGLSPLVIGGVIVGAVAVIGIAVVLVQGLAPRASSPPPAAQAATTPTVAVQPIVSSYVYDNFDNPAFDGSFDPSLWLKDEQGCAPSQMQGSMVASNDPSPDKDVYCGLIVSRPTRVSPAEMGTLQARLKFSQTSAQGNSNTAMTIKGYDPTGNDLIWMAHCGLAADQRGVQAFFQIQNKSKDTFTVQDSAYREWPAEADHWYTIQMKVNPETTIITCLVDGQLLASVAPDNAVGVKDQLLGRDLDTWRSALAAAVSHFDDFIIVPPDVPAGPEVVTAPTAAGAPTALATVYDNFDNPAFDGSFDPSLWFKHDWDTCAYTQRSGSMVVDNAPPDKEIACSLRVGRPTRVGPMEIETLQARMKISQTSAQGASFSSIGLTGFSPTGNDRLWMANCGLAADPAGVKAHFEIQNIAKDTYKFQDSAYREWLAESDHWYTIRMKLDPATMVITCLVDGRLLASAAPDNAVGVTDQLIERGLDNWRSAQSVALAAMDDFTILPPDTQ